MSTSGLTFPFRADGFTRYSEEHAIPYVLRRPLAANAQPGKFWFLQQPVGNSYAVSAPGTSVPNYITLGNAERDCQTTSSVNGGAEAAFFTEFLIGPDQSTAGGDAFADADFGSVFWVVNNNTIGKLSNQGGNNRSMGGLFWGLDFEQNKPVISVGPMSWQLARAVHTADNESAGNYTYAQDATATTDLGTVSGSALATIGFFLPRPKRHGLITSIEIIPSAALAAAGTNFRTITIYKLDTTGGVALASSPVVATFSTATQALVAGQPTQFTLSGTAANLNLVETDLLVGTSIHTASGATVPLGIIRSNMKVL